MNRAGAHIVAACSLLSVSCGRVGYDILPAPSGGDGTSRSSGGTSADDATVAGGGAGAATPFDGGLGGTANVGGDSGTADATTVTDGAIPQAPPTVSAVCGFDMLTIVQDGNAGDNAASATLATAIRNGCSSTPTTRTVNQNDPGILDANTGRPLLGPGDLAVLAGGPSSAQRAIAYLDISDTPLRLNTSRSGTYEIDERATGRAVVRVMQSTLGATHDFALVMIVYEPIGKTTVVSTYARGAEGTSAGAFWFASGAAGPIPSSTRHWYVVEWTNTDRTAGPSADDTFTLVASG